mmetsp:Transcript_12398/g.26287  ORF Transcript_12398/g.26287 Transcript_12398/m.26287 type:complete len:81 (+) Transcript_12398:42-284(+)
MAGTIHTTMHRREGRGGEKYYAIAVPELDMLLETVANLAYSPWGRPRGCILLRGGRAAKNFFINRTPQIKIEIQNEIQIS